MYVFGGILKATDMVTPYSIQESCLNEFKMAELSGFLFDAIDPKTQHQQANFTKPNAMGPPWVQVVVKRTSFRPARWAINLVTWENQLLKIDR